MSDLSKAKPANQLAVLVRAAKEVGFYPQDTEHVEAYMNHCVKRDSQSWLKRMCMTLVDRLYTMVEEFTALVITWIVTTLLFTSLVYLLHDPSWHFLAILPIVLVVTGVALSVFKLSLEEASSSHPECWRIVRSVEWIRYKVEARPDWTVNNLFVTDDRRIMVSKLMHTMPRGTTFWVHAYYVDAVQVDPVLEVKLPGGQYFYASVWGDPRYEPQAHELLQ